MTIGGMGGGMTPLQGVQSKTKTIRAPKAPTEDTRVESGKEEDFKTKKKSFESVRSKGSKLKKSVNVVMAAQQLKKGIQQTGSERLNSNMQKSMQLKSVAKEMGGITSESLLAARAKLKPVSQHAVLNLGDVSEKSTTKESSRSRKLGSEVGGVSLERGRLPDADGTIDIVGHSSDGGMKIEGKDPRQLAQFLKQKFGLQQIKTIHLVSCKSEQFKSEFQDALTELGVEVENIAVAKGKVAVDRATGKTLDEAIVGDLGSIDGHDGGLGINQDTLATIASDSGFPIDEVSDMANKIDTMVKQGTPRAEIENYYEFLFDGDADAVAGLRAASLIMDVYSLPAPGVSNPAPLDTPESRRAIGTLDRVSVLKSLAQHVTTDRNFSQGRYGAEKPFEVLSNLEPNCQALLVDPGICSSKHLESFEAFVKLHQPPFADAWAARAAFSESLGTTVFHRAVTVRPEIMEQIRVQGFNPSLFRELGSSPLDQQPDFSELTTQPISTVVLHHLRDISRTNDAPNPFTDDFQDFIKAGSIMDLKASLTIMPKREAPKKLSIQERLAQKTNASSRSARPKPDISQFVERVEAFKGRALELRHALQAKGGDTADKYRSQLEQSIDHASDISFEPFTATEAKKLDRLFNTMFKASREALIRPELRRRDPMQSLTQIEDIANSVASNPDLTGVADDPLKKTYLFQITVPNLDVLDPLEYLDRSEFPDVSVVTYPGQDPVRYEMSEKIESLVMGGIPASSIKGVPKEITNPPTMDSVYRRR